MMSAPLVAQKRPAETIDLDLDYRRQLAAGETIVSATVSVVGAGTITVGATPAVASPIVTVRVSGGTEGVTDSFEVLATTSTGEVFEATIYVAVGTESISDSTFCALAGFVEDGSGGPATNCFVRVRVLGGVSAVTGGVSLSATPMSEYTDEEGVFQFTLPRGALARIEIPESDLDASFTVPDLAIATLENVTLTEYDP